MPTENRKGLNNTFRNSIRLALLFSIAFPYSSDSEAGLSLVSRANCAWGVNESISWDLSAYHWLWTDSYHYYNGDYQHLVRTGWANTWRSRAAHDFEAWGGWAVYGVHWRWTSSTGTYWMGSTTAYGCNL